MSTCDFESNRFTTALLQHYYIITTSSLFASVTTHYYQVPLLPNPTRITTYYYHYYHYLQGQLADAGMYWPVPYGTRWYKVVQGGTRRYEKLYKKVQGGSHQQTGVLLWHHYDIWNKLCPLWHYYDTIITLITFTKVWLLLHIMTKSRKTLLLHLWQFYYCHYDISNILWHLWLLLHYYIHYCISNYYNTYNIEVLLLAIMTNAKHYVHYGYYINCYNMNNSHKSNNIFLLISTHKRGIWG